MLNVINFPNISPDIFKIDIGFLSFALKWYALAYIMGLLLAWRIIVKMVENPSLWINQQAPMTKNKPEELLTWMIIGVILGGRLGFVLFYQADYYLQNPFEILMVWRGGMSFHGGFIGVIISGIIFCYKNKLSVLSVGDPIAITTPIGLFLGRIANFINGELFGRPSNMPWAVIFPNEEGENCIRGITEICGRHPSQLYEAILEGLILGLILFWGAYFKSWLKTPGFSISIFFIGYGIARFFVEIFRQPDTYYITESNPFGYMIQMTNFGLTSGQVLSIPMVLIGIFIMIKALRIL
jgi:phosphatidylglycerol---prolipoprotein diacylglyceryl transferase